MVKRKVSKHKRITADGKVYYYYPKKRKPGPKKKRGPKKKKKTFWVRRVFPPWEYRLMLFGNKKQTKILGRFHDEMEVYNKKEELLLENSKVILPVIQLNNGRIDNKIHDWDLEYVILQKRNDNNSLIKLPNKYGKLVECTLDSDEWIIWDKFPCLIEEKFWVFGYNNKTERKTITWIYENIIAPKIENRYNILRVHLYNNKIVLQDDYNNIELIICKNISDSIRFYNKLQEYFCVKDKNIIFCGLLKRNKDYFKKIFNLIKLKTKWNDKDIYRTSTRH